METRLQQLFTRYIDNRASAQEVEELVQLLQDEQRDGELEPVMERLWVETDQNVSYPVDWAAMYNRIISTRQAPVRRMKMWRWVAAAVIIGIIVTGYFIISNSKTERAADVIAKSDVAAPDKQRAQLTLADGTVIYLDSLEAGTVAQQSNVNVIRTADGKLVYSREAGIVGAELQYNTLTNPRGSKIIDMTLSDGSHVWLNAGSSVTYPVAFTGNERKVNISGEAYFEIAHDAKKPFSVTKGELVVQVLGTKFNVNAYDDEPEIRVTLLEGSVAVQTKVDQLKIRPGQQAVRTNDNRLTTNDSPDLEAILAWKNDRFIFSGNNIQSVMRQLARWYDVEVKYEGTIPTDEFVGVISRSRYENISAILTILERTKTVGFTVKGRTVTVRNIDQ